jgi:perosamine synthetase
MKSIPFYLPDIGEEEIKEIKNALDLPELSKSTQLEEETQRYLNVHYAISTNNGTSALHLCMCAIDLKRGDKVIVPVNAHPNIPEVIRHFDAEPIFVDIHPDDYCIDLDACEAVLKTQPSKKLKAIVISHIGGQSADLERAYALKKKYQIKIIEDAALALGGTHQGKKIGSLQGDVTVFSFEPDMFSSIANGGIMTTNHQDIAERARLLRYHAWSHSAWNRYETSEYVYDITDLGLRYDISELDAAYCIAKLHKLDYIIAHQKKISDIYTNALLGVQHIRIPEQIRDHIFSLYIIKIDKNRDGFAKELKAEGVIPGLHYIPLHLLGYYKHKYNLKVNDFPVALRNYQQILSLPIHTKITPDTAHAIAKLIQKIAENRV